jgi:DNA-binding winged helix-turn-helix (wHTH) protein
MSSERDIPLPISYRAELLKRIMPMLHAGESCSLVGTSGVGKSNLVRFLQRPDVQAAYWGDDRAWVVAIDTHGLVFDDLPQEYAIAELMIHRLIREAERRALAADVLADFNEKYRHVIERPSTHLALRYLERICGRLCETHNIRLIFAFDQFEDVWRSLDARLFLNLRHLRDEFKYRLTYLVMTRERLQRVRQRARDDLPAVEAFCELFTSHVYGLGMYSPSDAKTMLDRIAERRGAVLDSDLQRAILAGGGGHPGLLRAVFWALHDTPAGKAGAAALLQIDVVAEECAKIWNDLLPEEQYIFRSIAADAAQIPSDNPALSDLQLKEIVVGMPPALFSPLFRDYALNQAGDMSGIVVAPRMRQVWLDGQPLAKVLAPLEFTLLEYLARNASQVCRREDILRELYQKEQYIDVNDERLDTLLRRLRETLKEDARNPRYLITHRGVGIQLANGRVRE